MPGDHPASKAIRSGLSLKVEKIVEMIRRLHDYLSGNIFPIFSKYASSKKFGKIWSLLLFRILQSARHYNNTYKDYTYTTNKCDITNMFLFTAISKAIYK